jgi:hypothetical protein
MKNSFSSILRFLALVALVPFTIACEEEPEASDDVLNTEVETLADDEALVDDIFEDIDEITLEAAEYQESGRYLSEGGTTSAACVSRSVERSLDNGLQSTVTLAFADGCEGPKGRVRSGTILVSRQFDRTNSTYTLSTTFQDFFLDGKKIEGTRTMVYKSDGEEIITVNINLSGGKITLPDAREITRDGSFTKTIDRNSGEISLQGSASGVNRNGVAYTSTISSPLLYKRACATDGIKMAVGGTRVISRDGRPEVSINYGSGDCDRSVDITAEGRRKTIEINISQN